MRKEKEGSRESERKTSFGSDGALGSSGHRRPRRFANSSSVPLARFPHLALPPQRASRHVVHRIAEPGELGEPRPFRARVVGAVARGRVGEAGVVGDLDRRRRRRCFRSRSRSRCRVVSVVGVVVHRVVRLLSYSRRCSSLWGRRGRGRRRRGGILLHSTSLVGRRCRRHRQRRRRRQCERRQGEQCDRCRGSPRGEQA